LVLPIEVVTVTVLPVRAAPAPIVNVAVTVLSFTTVRPLTVMPPPDTFTAVAPVSPVPLSVTGTLVARWPEVGLIDASVGPVTVNVTLPVVPPDVLMVTFLAVSAAVFEMVKVAVALSLAISPNMKDKGRYFEVTAGDYPPIRQACVILSSSKNKDSAKQLLAFIKTAAVSDTLKKYGFDVKTSGQ
jgi:hypothetical protein